MTDKIRVWPREGVLVRDELTRAPIEPGQEVERTRAIERRLRDGDLREQEAQAPAADIEHEER